MAAAWANHRVMLERFGENNFRADLRAAWYAHRESMKRWLTINQPRLSYAEQIEAGEREFYSQFARAEIAESIRLATAEQADIFFTHRRYTPRHDDLTLRVLSLTRGLNYAKDADK
jgi:hypothetical protein